MRLSGTKATAIHQYRGLGNQLWDLAGTRPSLDLQFSESKSLNDAATGENLVNHTRAGGAANAATYVGSDGLIKTATTNYLLWSEEFENAAWTAIRANPVDNTATAPNGKLTASTFTATDIDPYIFQTVSLPAGTYTFSVYIKAKSGNSTNNLRLRVADATLGVLSSSVLTLATEWQRFQYTVACPNGITQVRIDAPDQTGAAGDVVYLWGAQLEQSSTVGEYVPTTSTINSAPRFDHDPTTGESLGLLVEESRTNLLPVSEDVTFPSYQRGEITPSINTAVAPDGSTTADTIAPTAVLTEHFIGYTTPSNVTAGTTYTFSAFVKPNGTDSVRIRFAFTGFNNENGSHNFTTGITSAGNCDFQIQPYANGWYRIQGTAVASSTGAAQPRIYPKGLNSWLGVPSEALFVWGAQLEEDSFPTSYIPTEGTTVTRAADVASISGANFSSWYRQDEGTVFAEANGSGPLIIPRATASAVDRIQLVIGISAVVVSGSVQAGFGNTTAAKRVLAYKANNTNMAFDGVTGVNDTSCAIPSVDYATIGYLDFGGATRNNGAIKRITFWPQRLPDETLQTITQ